MLDNQPETEYTEDDVEELEEKLQEIKNQEGIIGYTLRSSKSASIGTASGRREHSAEDRFLPAAAPGTRSSRVS